MGIAPKSMTACGVFHAPEKCEQMQVCMEEGTQHLDGRLIVHHQRPSQLLQRLYSTCSTSTLVGQHTAVVSLLFCATTDSVHVTNLACCYKGLQLVASHQRGCSRRIGSSQAARRSTFGEPMRRTVGLVRGRWGHVAYTLRRLAMVRAWRLPLRRVFNSSRRFWEGFEG